MAEVNRRFKDHYGVPVRVIRWEPQTRRVIYLREGYDHECFSPLEQFQRKFTELKDDHEPVPPTSKSRLSCTDDDALIIEGCLARLQKRKPYEHSLLVAHYLYGISKRKIAKARKKDEKLIRIEIQMAEGFIDGCLSMLDVKLEMD